MKILKRNQIIISVIALMLMTAGYLNFANQKKESDLIPTSSVADSELMAGIGDAKLVSANEVFDKDQVANVENKNQVNVENNTNNTVGANNNATSSEDEYFNETRLEREKMYSQMLENYQKILEVNNISTDEKKNAQDEIKEINKEKNSIMIAENLIKTKGFKDVIIFKNNGNVTVVIKSDKLEEEEISQVQNIITRELNVAVNKINISNK